MIEARLAEAVGAIGSAPVDPVAARALRRLAEAVAHRRA